MNPLGDTPTERRWAVWDPTISPRSPWAVMSYSWLLVYRVGDDEWWYLFHLLVRGQ